MEGDLLENILITGSTGFIGACLLENLVKENYNVSIIIRKKSNLWRINKFLDKVNVYYCDICDKKTVSDVVDKIQPDYIFHLATYGAYYFQNDDDQIIKTNIIGTKNLVDACNKIDYKAFINVGSSSEYGIKNKRMSEGDLLEPINTYGVSKASATLYCNMISKVLKKPIGTVRLFSVYGRYEDKSRLFPSIILSCLNGENPKLANQHAVRDFIYVDDVVNFMKYVAFNQKIGGKIYNLGSGIQHSIKDVFDKAKEISGADIIPLWGSLEGRKSDTPVWVSDMSVVKKQLGWMPEYSLERGITETIEWFKNNRHLYS